MPRGKLFARKKKPGQVKSRHHLPMEAPNNPMAVAKRRTKVLNLITKKGYTREEVMDVTGMSPRAIRADIGHILKYSNLTSVEREALQRSSVPASIAASARNLVGKKKTFKGPVVTVSRPMGELTRITKNMSERQAKQAENNNIYIYKFRGLDNATIAKNMQVPVQEVRARINAMIKTGSLSRADIKTLRARGRAPKIVNTQKPRGVKATIKRLGKDAWFRHQERTPSAPKGPRHATIAEMEERAASGSQKLMNDNIAPLGGRPSVARETLSRQMRESRLAGEEKAVASRAESRRLQQGNEPFLRDQKARGVDVSSAATGGRSSEKYRMVQADEHPHTHIPGAEGARAVRTFDGVKEGRTAVSDPYVTPERIAATKRGLEKSRQMDDSRRRARLLEYVQRGGDIRRYYSYMKGNLSAMTIYEDARKLLENPKLQPETRKRIEAMLEPKKK